MGNTAKGKMQYAHARDSNTFHKNFNLFYPTLKGFATFWEFSFYGQKKFADYEYHSLFAEKIHFHT